jgi:hypothetical protein
VVNVQAVPEDKIDQTVVLDAVSIMKASKQCGNPGGLGVPKNFKVLMSLTARLTWNPSRHVAVDLAILLDSWVTWYVLNEDNWGLRSMASQVVFFFFFGGGIGV